MKKLILASSSIHRKKLLRQLKLKFTVIKPNIDESRKKGEEINKFVKRLSYEKAMKVAAKNVNAIVIGSDEVALINEKVLGKPKTVNNASTGMQAQYRVTRGLNANFSAPPLTASDEVDFTLQEFKVITTITTD